MPLYELTRESLQEIPRTTLQQQSYRERDDVQRLLRADLSIVENGLLLLAEEFSQWEDSRRRIDLLAVDRSGTLVVIELKRTEDGGAMELQALRYAAMVSTLTLQQAAVAYAKQSNIDVDEAQAAITDFVDLNSSTASFGKKVRIVLISPDFSRELTTSVLWLNSFGLDVRCVRLRPYQLDQRTLLEVDQIIPLREAQEYTVRLKEKQDEVRRAEETTKDYTRYELTANSEVFTDLTKRELAWKIVAFAVAGGMTLPTLQRLLPARRMIVVKGILSGQSFYDAARSERERTGYVFQPKRFFMEDEKLILVGHSTIALSNQWALPKLQLLDEIIAAIPHGSVSYREVQR